MKIMTESFCITTRRLNVYIPICRENVERLPTFLGHEHCVRLSITNSLTITRYIVDGDLLGVGGLNLNFTILFVFIVIYISIIWFRIRYGLIKIELIHMTESIFIK